MRFQGLCCLPLSLCTFCWRSKVFLVALVITFLVGAYREFFRLENHLGEITSTNVLFSSRININNITTNNSPYIVQESAYNTDMSKSNFSSIKDDFPFRYLINEPKFCTNNEDLYIINIVGTAPSQYMARSYIRKLWGNKMWQNMTGFRTVFLLGEVYDQKLMDDVREESNRHQDIIQFSFLDTYDNLTLKTLCGFHWINTFCPIPPWVLKSDTDVLVNIFELSSFLHKYDEANQNKRDHFFCNIRGPAKPCRTNCNMKWRMSWEEYPHTMYPAYCMGPGYIIPRRLLAPLYQAANKTHPFRMEDVYYTGIIPEQLGWKKIKSNIAHRFPWRPKAWQDSFSTTDLMILELDNGFGGDAKFFVWINILDHKGLLSTNSNGTSLNKDKNGILNI